MQEQPVDMKVQEEALERLEAEMDARGMEHGKPASSDARPIRGRKAALAQKQRRHYAIQAKLARDKHPRFKGFRTTLPSTGLSPRVGPSEKALERATKRA